MKSVKEAQDAVYGKDCGPPMLPHGSDPLAVSLRRARRKSRQKAEPVSSSNSLPSPKARFHPSTHDDLSRSSPFFPASELPAGFPKELSFRALAAYSLLRTLSIHLRLSPFTPNVFLRALYLPFPNRLLGKIHVALLRLLLCNLHMGYHWGNKPHPSSHATSLKTTPVYFVTKKRRVDGIRWPLQAGDNLDLLDHYTWPLFYDDYCHLTADTIYASLHDARSYLDWRSLDVSQIRTNNNSNNNNDDDDDKGTHDERDYDQQKKLSSKPNTRPSRQAKSSRKNYRQDEEDSDDDDDEDDDNNSKNDDSDSEELPDDDFVNDSDEEFRLEDTYSPRNYDDDSKRSSSCSLSEMEGDGDDNDDNKEIFLSRRSGNKRKRNSAAAAAKRSKMATAAQPSLSQRTKNQLHTASGTPSKKKQTLPALPEPHHASQNVQQYYQQQLPAYLEENNHTAVTDAATSAAADLSSTHSPPLTPGGWASAATRQYLIHHQVLSSSRENPDYQHHHHHHLPNLFSYDDLAAATSAVGQASSTLRWQSSSAINTMSSSQMNGMDSRAAMFQGDPIDDTHHAADLRMRSKITTGDDQATQPVRPANKSDLEDESTQRDVTNESMMHSIQPNTKQHHRSMSNSAILEVEHPSKMPLGSGGSKSRMSLDNSKEGLLRSMNENGTQIDQSEDSSNIVGGILVPKPPSFLQQQAVVASNVQFGSIDPKSYTSSPNLSAGIVESEIANDCEQNDEIMGTADLSNKETKRDDVSPGSAVREVEYPSSQNAKKESWKTPDTDRRSNSKMPLVEAAPQNERRDQHFFKKDATAELLMVNCKRSRSEPSEESKSSKEAKVAPSPQTSSDKVKLVVDKSDHSKNETEATSSSPLKTENSIALSRISPPELNKFRSQLEPGNPQSLLLRAVAVPPFAESTQPCKVTKNHEIPPFSHSYRDAESLLPNFSLPEAVSDNSFEPLSTQDVSKRVSTALSVCVLQEWDSRPTCSNEDVEEKALLLKEGSDVEKINGLRDRSTDGGAQPAVRPMFGPSSDHATVEERSKPAPNGGLSCNYDGGTDYSPADVLIDFITGEMPQAMNHVYANTECEMAKLDHVADLGAETEPSSWLHFQPLSDMRRGVPYHCLSVERKLIMLEFLLDELLSSELISSEFQRRRMINAQFDCLYGVLPSKAELNNLCNADDCAVCLLEGDLLCCDGCISSYHRECIGMSCGQSLPDGQWLCPECKVQDPAKFGPLYGGQKSALDWFTVDDIARGLKAKTMNGTAAFEERQKEMVTKEVSAALEFNPGISDIVPSSRNDKSNNQFLVVHGFVFERVIEDRQHTCYQFEKLSAAPSPVEAGYLENLLLSTGWCTTMPWPLAQIPMSHTYFSMMERFDPSFYVNDYRTAPLIPPVPRLKNLPPPDYESRCCVDATLKLSEHLSSKFGEDRSVVRALQRRNSVYDPLHLIKGFLRKLEGDLGKACLLKESWPITSYGCEESSWSKEVKDCFSVRRLSSLLLQLVDNAHTRVFIDAWLCPAESKLQNDSFMNDLLQDAGPSVKLTSETPSAIMVEANRWQWERSSAHHISLLLAKDSCRLQDWIAELRPDLQLNRQTRKKRKATSDGNCANRELLSHPSNMPFVQLFQPFGKDLATDSTSSGEAPTLRSTRRLDRAAFDRRVEPNTKDAALKLNVDTMAISKLLEGEKRKKMADLAKELTHPTFKEPHWPGAGRLLFDPIGYLPRPAIRRLGRKAGCVVAPFAVYSDAYEVGQAAVFHVWRKRVLSCESYEDLLLSIRVLESFLDFQVRQNMFLVKGAQKSNSLTP